MTILQFPDPKLIIESQFIDLDDLETINSTRSALLRMYATLPYNKCGLAAPQIGINLNMAIVLGSPMFNLEFKPANQLDTDKEGCYSVEHAKKFVSIQRPKYGWAKWVDGVTFELHNEKINGFFARVFQHELDHINGISCLI